MIFIFMFEVQDVYTLSNVKEAFQESYGNQAEINSMHKVTKIPGKVQDTRKYDIHKNIMQVQLISQA